MRPRNPSPATGCPHLQPNNAESWLSRAAASALLLLVAARHDRGLLVLAAGAISPASDVLAAAALCAHRLGPRRSSAACWGTAFATSLATVFLAALGSLAGAWIAHVGSNEITSRAPPGHRSYWFELCAMLVAGVFAVRAASPVARFTSRIARCAASFLAIASVHRLATSLAVVDTAAAAIFDRWTVILPAGSLAVFALAAFASARAHRLPARAAVLATVSHHPERAGSEISAAPRASGADRSTSAGDGDAGPARTNLERLVHAMASSSPVALWLDGPSPMTDGGPIVGFVVDVERRGNARRFTLAASTAWASPRRSFALASVRRVASLSTWSTRPSSARRNEAPD